ncbi:MAG: ABC transporter substrate-binding protein [Alphaproteobacteria bacterium]|nr:ABC transporter substrate-binding protein [Alphaproteobacteria bacterium]MCW5739878.1 ABC transporter substrate-binding protein [Alphaproteobacteria bacterium]
MRRLLVASCAMLAALAATPFANAQTTLRVAMHADLKVFDPIWSGAYIVRNHGYMVYDTLFAMDDNYVVKPQMVDTWNVSDDGLTWTFKLRDGLEFHDGTPVTPDDVIASLKRWAVRDSMGLKLTQALKEYKVVDPLTFQIVLKEQFGAVVESLGKPSVVVPFIMPKRIAETDPFKQIDDYTGSGPFILKKDEWKPGAITVYVKNPKYKPRGEPASGLGGGKVVGVDRVEWVWMPDTETQVNALAKGEIDMIESVNHDVLPILEKDKGVRLIRGRASNQVTFRMNWLIPPFNDARVRRAAMVALGQEEFLQASIGDSRFYRQCKALFTCETPLASDAGMADVLNGNAQKARAMLKEAGQEGALVVMPQPTDLQVLRPWPLVAKAQLERAGFKVDVQATDWTSMVNRLVTKKGPVAEGGWNAFVTSWAQVDILDPLMHPSLASTCEKARAGWPCDEQMEKLRDKYVRSKSLAERKAAVDEIQRHQASIVTHVHLGEWFGVSAVRANIQTRAVPSPVTVFWSVTKK